MDAYDICTNLGKNPADIVAIYGRGRKLFRPPTYLIICLSMIQYSPLLRNLLPSSTGIIFLSP